VLPEWVFLSLGLSPFVYFLRLRERSPRCVEQAFFSASHALSPFKPHQPLLLYSLVSGSASRNGSAGACSSCSLLPVALAFPCYRGGGWRSPVAAVPCSHPCGGAHAVFLWLLDGQEAEYVREALGVEEGMGYNVFWWSLMPHLRSVLSARQTMVGRPANLSLLGCRMRKGSDI
jgi:hypothetical protein